MKRKNQEPVCDVKGCRRKDICLNYKGHKICEEHWDKHSDDNNNFDLNTAEYKNTECVL